MGKSKPIGGVCVRFLHLGFLKFQRLLPFSLLQSLLYTECLVSLGVIPFRLFKEAEVHTFTKMQNEERVNMDLYIPRNCSATNRLITSKDRASVQINIGHLDENGIYTGHFSTFALCGFLRARGDGDSALDRLRQTKKAELRQ